MTIHFDSYGILVAYFVMPAAGAFIGRWLQTRWLFWRTGRKISKNLLDKTLR